MAAQTSSNTSHVKNGSVAGPSSLKKTGIKNHQPTLNNTVGIHSGLDCDFKATCRCSLNSSAICDSDINVIENVTLPGEITTGREECVTIDGIKFLTFETEYDLNEFTKVEEDFKGFEDSDIQGDEGLFLSDNVKSYQDHTEGIVLRKTRDFKKVKGWKNKMFAGNENGWELHNPDQKIVEFDDGFESSDIKVEPGTCFERTESLVAWYDHVSTTEMSCDVNNSIKEEQDDYSIDVENISLPDDSSEWNNEVDNMDTSLEEQVLSDESPVRSEDNIPAFQSERLDEYMKRAQLSCGLPDVDEPEDFSSIDKRAYYQNVTETSCSPKSTPRVVTKAKTLAEKRKLMNLTKVHSKTVSPNKSVNVKYIMPAKKLFQPKCHQFGREVVIEKLDPDYKYVWMEGKPIKIVGSKGCLNTRLKRRIPKPASQHRPKPPPSSRHIPVGMNTSPTTHGSKASSTVLPQPLSDTWCGSRKSKSETSPIEQFDIRRRLRPRKVSIIPPTAANHSDFFDRFPTTQGLRIRDLSNSVTKSEPFVFGITVHPQIHKPLNGISEACIQSLRSNCIDMKEDWIKFSTSVVTSLKSSVPPATAVMLVVSHQYEGGSKTACLIPATRPALKYITPRLACQSVTLPRAKSNILPFVTICVNRHTEESLSTCGNIPEEISAVMEDMLKYIELKEMLSSKFVRYDPDDRIVDESSLSLGPAGCKKKGSALEYEMKRLNVKIIDLEEVNGPSLKQVGDKCVKEFCRFGCVCSSIITANHGVINHCRQPGCIFQCTCDSYLPMEDYSKLSLTAVSKIHETTRHLAKVEKEFKQTVVRGNVELYVVTYNGGRSKREIKLPERYRSSEVQLSSEFEIADTRMMSVINKAPLAKLGNCPEVTTGMLGQKQKNYIEFTPKHTVKTQMKNPISQLKKRKLNDMTRHYTEMGVIKPSHVLMFCAIGLEDVKVFCMDHSRYNCECDVHPRKMKKLTNSTSQLHSASPEKVASYHESIYQASIDLNKAEECKTNVSIRDVLRTPTPDPAQGRCVATKRTMPRVYQVKKRATTKASELVTSPVMSCQSKVVAESPQVSTTSPSRVQHGIKLSLPSVLGRNAQVSSSIATHTQLSGKKLQGTLSMPSLRSVLARNPQFSQSPVQESALQLNIPLSTDQVNELSVDNGMSLLDEAHKQNRLDLQCDEILSEPEGITENSATSNQAGILPNPSSMKVSTISCEKSKPLPQPRLENASIRVMQNHANRLRDVLSRKRTELQALITRGVHALDLNVRTADTLQLIKWNVLQKRFSERSLQLWVTKLNTLGHRKVLVTERKNELPSVLCNNLWTVNNVEHFDKLPHLAKDIISFTADDGFYAVLYCDGSNWELCEQMRGNEIMSQGNYPLPNVCFDKERGTLKNTSHQMLYELLLPKFNEPVRWYSIDLTIEFDFLLLATEFKVPYSHLFSVSNKCIESRNPIRYPVDGVLTKRYKMKNVFGIYACPNHETLLFLGPFKYSEDCSVRMLVKNMTLGHFNYCEIRNTKNENGWWYATNGNEKTLSCMQKDHAEPSLNVIPASNNVTNQNTTEETQQEQSTTMPIITSVISLQNMPNSQWQTLSASPVDKEQSGVHLKQFRPILPNISKTVNKVVDNTKANRVSTDNKNKKTISRTDGIIVRVRLEPSLPHVGHFRANVYGESYQIFLPGNKNRFVKNLEDAIKLINELIQAQSEFDPPNLKLTWKPVLISEPPTSNAFNFNIFKKKHVITESEVLNKEQFKIMQILNAAKVQQALRLGSDAKPAPRKRTVHKKTRLSTKTRSQKVKMLGKETSVSTETCSQEVGTLDKKTSVSTKTRSLEVGTLDKETSVSTKTHCQEVETLIKKTFVLSETNSQEVGTLGKETAVSTKTRSQEVGTLGKETSVSTKTHSQEVETLVKKTFVLTKPHSQEVETLGKETSVSAGTHSQEVKTLGKEMSVSTKTRSQEVETLGKKTSVLTKTHSQEVETLGKETSVPTETRSQKISNQSKLPPELHKPVSRLVKVVGTRKDFWNNTIKEIDFVNKNERHLSEKVQHLKQIRHNLLQKLEKIIKTIKSKDERNKAVAEIQRILKYMYKKTQSTSNLGTISRNKEDDSSLASVERVYASGQPGNISYDYHNREDAQGGETSSDYKDSQIGSESDENEVADINGSCESDIGEIFSADSSNNIVNERNSAQSKKLSIIEKVDRRHLKIPKDTDIALCDSSSNLRRKEPDKLTIEKEENVTVTILQGNGCTKVPNIVCNKLMSAPEVTAGGIVTIEQQSKDIEVLDLTGDEVKVLSLKEKVQIETIELEDDDISQLEASELDIVEKMQLDNSAASLNFEKIEVLPENTKTNQSSNRNPNIGLERHSDIVISKQPNSGLKPAQPGWQNIFPVSREMSTSHHSTGILNAVPYKQFQKLSCLKHGVNSSGVKLHIQDLPPFPPYEFIRVPPMSSTSQSPQTQEKRFYPPAKSSAVLSTSTKPSTPANPSTSTKLVPTSSKLLSTSAKPADIPRQASASLQFTSSEHGASTKPKTVTIQSKQLQSVLSTSESVQSKPKQYQQTRVSKVPENAIQVSLAQNQMPLTSSQSISPVSPNKTVSVVLKNGKLQLLKVQQSNPAVRPMQVVIGKSSAAKLVNSSVYMPATVSGTPQPVTSLQKVPASLAGKHLGEVTKTGQNNAQSEVRKLQIVDFKSSNKRRLPGQIWKPTNMSLSKETAPKRLCVGSIHGSVPHFEESHASFVLDPSTANATFMTNVIQKESSANAQSVALAVQAVKHPGSTQNLTICTLPLKQTVQSTPQGKYFIKNDLSKPLKITDLKIVRRASTLSTSSGLPPKIVITKSTSPGKACVSLQKTDNVAPKKAGTIVRMFPSLSEEASSSTNPHNDKDN